MIEQYDGHFRIQRAQITSEKLLYTLQQTEILFCLSVLFETFWNYNCQF